MNRHEIESLFTESLKRELVNKSYEGKRIIDVKVELVTDTQHIGDYDSIDFETLKIFINLESIKGKISGWVPYYF